MKKRNAAEVFAFIFAVLTLAAAGCAHKTGPESTDVPDIGGAYKEMYNADFWIGNDCHKEIMSKDEIQVFNENMKNGSIYKLVDLENHPDELLEDELKERINTYSIPGKTRYTNPNARTPVTKEYYNKLRANRNMSAIKDVNPVRHAIIVNETSLRDFPDSAPSYEEEGNMDIDLFHENRMKVWEKCLVLHTSADGKWYFIQTMSFRGWISSEDAAICSKEDWKKYNERDFLVITGNRVVMDRNPYDDNTSGKEMLMGTRLPLAADSGEIDRVSTVSSYSVVLPYRGEDGRLNEKTGRIPKNADVNTGYLPLTGENIIRQSFKMLGERYGWGGSLNARDCSSFIRDIYFCFGIELPRNSAGQGAMQTRRKPNVSYMEDDKKENTIMSQHPGAILEMQGHVMIYLGAYKGKAYVIHSVYAFGESGKNGADGRKNISCVTVSDLYVTRKDGSTFLSNIKNITPFN